MAHPIVIVSLDGGAFEVLDPLMAGGDMPALAALAGDGMRGVLRSTVPPITPVAWTSFLTGKRPGRHGVWDFRLYDPGGYRDAFVSSRAVRDATVFELLAAAGLRVASVNVPMSYPPKPSAGTVVSGFDTPSVGAPFTQPPALRDRILKEIPDYVFVATAGDPRQQALDDAAFERFVAEAERSIGQRTAVANLLLDDGPWDVFLLHYQDPDALQHKLWRHLAGADPDPACRDRLRNVYRRLDADLAGLWRRMPPSALRLVMSDHGFGSHRGRVFPNVLLREWGYLAQPGRWRRRLRRSVRKRLVRLGLASRAERDRRWEAEVRERDFRRALAVHWPATRAYVAAAEIYGLLYLNLRGREPAGVVEPGTEAEALLDELSERLRAVRDPRDGRPVFADVLRGARIDPVDAHGRRPDLIVVPRPDLTVSRDLNDRLWLDHFHEELGTHRPDGILMAAGPGIRRGRLETAAALIDLAPTVLAAAGVGIPDDMDDRVLEELFETPPAVRRVAPVAPTAAGDAGLSADEEGAVAERLRALGYLA